jgi:hypothetical protein
MFAVVNHLHFAEPIAPDLFARAQRELEPLMHGVSGFEELYVIQPTDRHAILVILADQPETLDRLATEVGSPWMLEHVVPHLAAAPERLLGKVIVTTSRND